jgi:hypothetical protein
MYFFVLILLITTQVPTMHEAGGGSKTEISAEGLYE